MIIVIISMIIAWWLIVAFFAFATRIIPLKNYSENISKLQIVLSSCSVILGVFAFFYIKTNYSSGIFGESKWDEEGVALMLFLFSLCLIASLLRFFFDGKVKNNKIETFELKAGEYRIVKEFDLTLGDYIYMPNVKSYCEFSGGKIVFTGNMPNREADGEFTCRMIKDGIYECLSYEMSSDANRKIDFSRIFKISFCVLVAIDLALAMLWISQLYLDVISKWVQGLSVSLFGAALFNLYKGAKGILAKAMLGFSILLIIVGISSFFK